MYHMVSYLFYIYISIIYIFLIFSDDGGPLVYSSIASASPSATNLKYSFGTKHFEMYTLHCTYAYTFLIVHVIVAIASICTLCSNQNKIQYLH